MLRLGPRRLERPADRGVVLVGPLDSDMPIMVDAGGAISPTGAGWCLDWWIGADDRWYLPSREPSVRQRRPSAAPVVETVVRIPSGDASQVVYAVPGTPSPGLGMTQVTVVEYSNDSPVPVALAVAIRPYSVVADGSATDAEAAAEEGPTSGGAAPSIVIDRLDERTLMVADTVIRLPRPPAQLSAAADHDLLGDLMRGSTLSWSSPGVGPGANAVALYPLPHRTSLRLVIGTVGSRSAPGETGSGLDPDSMPPPDAVRRGWDAVVDGGGRFEFPDDGLTRAAAAARARLLLTPGPRLERLRQQLELPRDVPHGRLRAVLGRPPRTRPGLDARLPPDAGAPGLVLAAQARSGRWSETRTALDLIADSFPVAADPTHGANLVAGVGVAAATLAACSSDRDSNQITEPGGDLRRRLEGIVEPTLQLVTLLEKVSPADLDRARAGLALLMDALGQHRAAAELRSSMAEWTPTDDLAVRLGARDHETVTCLAAKAGGVGRSNGAGSDRVVQDGLASAAGFWLAARSLVFHEQPGVDTTTPPALDLLPGFPPAWRGGGLDVNRGPTLSGLVSFALRWHGARPALLWEVASPAPVTLTCRALDPDWSTVEPSGEVLLAGTTLGLIEAPGPGDSFR